MKIFLSFLQSGFKHAIPSYDFWEHYIKNGIAEAGYDWTECPNADWAMGLTQQSKTDHLKWKEETWGKTVDWLRKNPSDVFLSYLYPAQVDISAVKEIQKMGIPCVNFFCDNIRDFKKAPEEFKVFDLNWVPEYKALKMYKKAGYPHIHLPMPMWVAPRYRILREESNKQVTFIGSEDIQRKLLLEKVIKKKQDINLAIYGKGWASGDISLQPSTVGYTLKKKIAFNLDFVASNGVSAFMRKIEQRNIGYDESVFVSKVNQSLTFEEYNRLTSESMITLGINRYPSFHYSHLKPNRYSRLRDIEAPMLGACYLTEYTEGIGELYDINNEIMVYENEDGLIEKVNELKKDEGKRRKLKINGQKRALSDHQISNSLNKIIQKIFN